MSVPASLKVAVVHDWLTDFGGAEKVLQAILEIFPESDLFTIVDFMTEADKGVIANHKITTSFVQKMPFAKKKYRNYLPLMPYAVEQFDLTDYDLIISSSYAVAKGVISGPDQIHVSYCHSPIRYAWDMQYQYLAEANLDKGFRSLFIRYFLHKIRIWDQRTSNGVDYFIANSNFIARRIKKAYGRDSVVIHPNVDIESFKLCVSKDDFYLTASRMVPYKKIDLIVRAFNQMPDKKLVVIGSGPDLEKIKKSANSNVQILGYQPHSVLVDYMRRAKAFVFAAKEDFGIVPLEAQACGTPVIAFAKGGALETVNEGVSGTFFYSQDEMSIVKAVEDFEFIKEEFSPEIVRNNSLRFSKEIFQKNIIDLVDEAIRSKS